MEKNFIKLNSAIQDLEMIFKNADKSDLDDRFGQTLDCHLNPCYVEKLFSNFKIYQFLTGYLFKFMLFTSLLYKTRF